MGLDVPRLDDRDYEALLLDARKRIAVHSETWTDHTPQDPGVTLLEALVWVTEAYRYRLDRVTDAHVQKYLGLLGIRPTPPMPARAALQVTGSADSLPSALNGTTVPAGTTLLADDGTSTLTFETDADVSLTTARLVTVGTATGNEWMDWTDANDTTDVRFHPFSQRADSKRLFVLAFDADPFEDVRAQELSLWVSTPDGGSESATVGTPSLETTTAPATAVELVWEYYSNNGWVEFPNVDDGTGGFRWSGRVRLSRPDSWHPEELSDAAIPAFDPPDEQLLAVGIRCRIRDGGFGIAPQVSGVGCNVLTARHRATKSSTALSTSDGKRETTARAGQVFLFDHAPILEADIVLRDSDETSEPWQQVPDFDTSTPDSRHYVLDHTAGEIRFGDGIRGRVPTAGAHVVAEEYVVGGGVVGNVPRTTEWRFVDQPADWPATVALNATALASVDPTTGGRDSESIAEATARVRREFETPTRAVTADDFVYLATNTPHTDVARASAAVHPGDGPDGGDVVRVTVAPYGTLPGGSESTFDEGIYSAVEQYLSRHRLLTDRLDVVPVEYVGVGVDVEVRAVPGASSSTRAADIEARLDSFLDPLTGFDGNGWPFGHAVFKSEVYAAVEATEGVDSVVSVAFRASGETRADADGNLLVGESALVYPSVHRVTVLGATAGGRP